MIGIDEIACDYQTKIPSVLDNAHIVPMTFKPKF